MDDFIRRADAEIQRLLEEDEHLQATLRGIEARRAELAIAIAKGTTAVDYYRQLMKLDHAEEEEHPPAGVTVKVIETRKRRPKRTGALTMADRLADYMDLNGGEALVGDLADQLVDRGVYPEEQRPTLYRRVYATLLRDRRFYRVSPGRFGLVPQGNSLRFATTGGLGTVIRNSGIESVGEGVGVRIAEGAEITIR